MTDKPDLVIEPLGKKHTRAAFSCGSDELDTYLQRQASQDTKRRIARIFVVRSEADDQTILGYYTLHNLACMRFMGLDKTLYFNVSTFVVTAHFC